MKNKILGLAALLLLAAGGLQAQTNSTTSAIDFPQTAAQWFTSIDYTKSWPTNEFDLSVGGLWANNVQWANYLNAQKNINNFVLDGQLDNQGIAGTINRIQAGGGYRVLNRGDLAGQFTVNGGYDRTQVTGFIEPSLTFKKQMAHGTFSEISLNYDVLFKGKEPSYPGIKIGTGFTF
jgi:hypothetical protein